MESRVETFFRHCPACGHRFEIRLIGEKVVAETDSSAKMMPPTLSLGGMMMRSNLYPSQQPAGFAVLQDSIEPTIIDSKEFEYTYKCGHCGHVWHEVKDEDAKVSLPKGGTDEILEEDQDGPTPAEEEADEEADQS